MRSNSRVLVPLATGCEELEAVTVIDLLRRAGIQVVCAGLQPGSVVASRGTVLVPDTTLDDALREEYDMVVLPGGLPGANYLQGDDRIIRLIRTMAGQGKYTAAICAAPKVLAKAGLLEGRQATCYPGSLSQAELRGVQLSDKPVVQDGTTITSRGPGTAMDFALHLIEILAGRDARVQVEAGLQRPGH
jgi:4-methyl-5(b-hydroxyethyl)-thiazole monophosphate biosynthesis